MRPSNSACCRCAAAPAIEAPLASAAKNFASFSDVRIVRLEAGISSKGLLRSGFFWTPPNAAALGALKGGTLPRVCMSMHDG